MNRRAHRQSAEPVTPAALENIQTVADMEEEFLRERTFWDRVADFVAGISGSIGFVIVHLLGFVAWFSINLGLVPGIRPFDPYPFILLAMAVSCEAVLLSTFVLMKQNRMAHRAEQRDHLHLQIALLAEKEITKLLQSQQRIGERLGLADVAYDKESKELSQNTALDSLARELKRKLPEEAL